MSNFIKSDYCQECDGDGMSPDDNGQCLECERLHDLEVRADIRHDIDKGN